MNVVNDDDADAAAANKGNNSSSSHLENAWQDDIMARNGWTKMYQSAGTRWVTVVKDDDRPNIKDDVRPTAAAVTAEKERELDDLCWSHFILYTDRRSHCLCRQNAS